jgi:molybdopterin synthase sulfur carrier subunit
MSVIVRIPTQLRPLTQGEGEVLVEAASVAEAIAALEVAHPGIGERLLDDNGALRRFVNLFLDDEDVRFLDGLRTPIKDGQTLSIVPAVAGSRGALPKGWVACGPATWFAISTQVMRVLMPGVRAEEGGRQKCRR